MKNFLLLSTFLLIGSVAFAQLGIPASGISPTIDFESSIQDVNNGTFLGNGFQDEPILGQLDSDSWATSGFSQNSDFGSGCTSGDCARGTDIDGGVSTGGIYAFIVDGNTFLGVQPGGSDFTPGTITLKVTNNTGLGINSVDISFDRLVNNDQARANSFNVSVSLQGQLAFDAVPTFDYTSPEASDSDGFTRQTVTGTITFSQTLPTGTFFEIRWTGDDVSGSGSRDEFGIDNISFEATEVTALPVTLTYFEATAADGQVDLNWETASEQANEYFAVEHSIDGENFETIGKVAGAGDAYVATRYSFLDDAPALGLNYYRLRQVDFDGNETILPTQVVRIGATLSDEDVKIAPSRTQGQFSIMTSAVLEGNVTYSLYNMSGQLVRTDTYSADNAVQWVDISDMSNGVYILQLETRLGTSTERIVKF